ncbi:hypothetical protein PFLUV_G00074240 [Perca fluviatilis]|uniref:Uncharacterized protein n=1 Tax=Perca fluviatilis TaxID=8168 RepID=A0A6A5FB93_PERFL|nr:uncharacterized protein LOC120560079 [Perca fluviatilis]KAF1389518.1 hypothetical protein PFLUV_G00074240 [Perca fluviatilis]
MKYRAGSVTVLCAWMVITMQSLDAGHAAKKHAAAVSCRPKELTALTKSVVQESLTGFEKANGGHLGTWPPGFPELREHHVQGSKVQCSLLFMSQGLEKVLNDQRNNLNPKDVSLHEKLKEAISSVHRLAECAKNILIGECSPKPPPPNMPRHAFERKQWSHTLLKTARDYLNWLESKFPVQKNKIKRKATEATHQKYLEGSGYLL